jgi:hypothetical protein
MQHGMGVADRARRQAALTHVLVDALNVERRQPTPPTVPTLRPDIASEQRLVILIACNAV